VDAKNPRDEPDADFLVEYFQNLLARAALDQFAVKFQTLDRLTTPDRDTQIQRLVLSRVILTRLRLCDDDVLDLGIASGKAWVGEAAKFANLIHQHIRPRVQSSSHRFI
jgi:hypothetical protein